jgi:FkbM family methyltransferase
MKNYIIKSHEHAQDSELLMNKLSTIPKKGVIHLGGHLGEEYEEYIKCGFENIIFIEANPELCQQMKIKFKDDDRVSIFNYAISDEVKMLDFYVYGSNNGVQASSILKMDKFNQIVPSLYTSHVINVQSLTIKEFIIRENIDTEKYNVLVSDIQGADFLAIQGADEKINLFDALIIEVQCIELYENFVSEKEIDDYLKIKKFERTFTIYHELYNEKGTFPAWGEALYTRKK